MVAINQECDTPPRSGLIGLVGAASMPDQSMAESAVAVWTGNGPGAFRKITLCFHYSV